MSLRVAMIGYGFMGAAHSVGWRQAPRVFDLPEDVELAVVVGRNEQAVAKAAAKWGWAEHATDWREVIARDDIDLVDIVTPGDSHAEIAIAALDAGKHVLCEKPLANSVEEAEAMAASAERAAERGVGAVVGLTDPRGPPGSRQLVDPSVPLGWRLRKEHAGSGALGDIGAHIVDLTQFVTGERVTRVSGTVETIVRKRPVLGERSGFTGSATGELGDVTVDDAAIFTGRLDGGALVSFEATRFATGRKNALTIEVSGTDGALAFDVERLNELRHYDRTAPAELQGFTTILVTEPEHPYVSAWWPPGHMLGYEHGFSHQVVDFVTAIAHGTELDPSFADGLAVQRVLAAVEESAAKDSAWVAVEAAVPANV